MKKITSLALFFSLFTLCKAQYTDIIDFNGTSTPQGLNPYGNLSLSVTGDTLFGMTAYGSGYGNIFCLSSGGYTDLYDFTGWDGLNPYGSLTVSGSILYGMTSYGGVWSAGNVFSINTDGSGYTDLLDFNGANGAFPWGNVILSGDSLFGMTSEGGSSNDGSIFLVTTSGTYTDLFDFNGYNGESPYGSLLLSRGKLVGMTYSGGTTSYGNIFTINPDGTGFTDLIDFNGNTGYQPYGSLISSPTGDTLFGMTSFGGYWGYGNIFSLVYGSGFTDLYDFSATGNDGAEPEGDLTFSGGMLYGMTNWGGISSYGNIFSIAPDGSNYVDLFDMNGSTGEYPYGDVTFSGGGIKFFGLASEGGANSDGVFFRYEILTAGVMKVTGVTCTSGNIGSADAVVSGGISPYTYYWNPGGSTNENIGGLSIGSYTVTVTDSVGSTATAVAVISGVNVSIERIVNVDCNGDANGLIQAHLSGGTGHYVYSWSNGEMGATDIGLTAGTYTVTLTDMCGMTATASATITQPTLLTMTDSVLTNVHCSGDSTGSIAAAASGGASPYTYSWSDASSQTTVTATGLSAGTYYITINDTNGCTAIDSAIINQPSKPPLGVSIARAKNVSCSGSFDGMALALASGGVPPYTYYWTPGSDTTSIVTGLSAGIYTVQITDTRGCNAVAVANISQPTVLRISDTTISSLTYAFPSGGTPPYSYYWTPGGITAAMVSGISSGTYTVVVTDANACQDSAVVFLAPPGIEFYIPSWLNTGISCNPGYIYFRIMAGQDTLQRFNSCVIDLDIGSEFKGDSATNGGVIIIPGANFQPGPGNDYDTLSVTNLSDTVIQIAFGNPADSSPNGTFLPITTDTMTLFTVKLKIQDCFVAPVAFADSYAPFSATYTALDSNIASIDLDTISSTWVCSNCALYPCSSSDGTLDSLCCCADSFTYITGYDTLYNYFYHTFPYNNTGDGGVENYCQCTQCPLVINTWTNPINAGTNGKSVPPNSSILTIEGDMFSSKQGEVTVTNANEDISYGVTLDSMDVLYWSNNKIIVKMPSYIINNPYATPGSGPFEIKNECNYSDSTRTLQINYGIINTDTISGTMSEKLRPNIVMANNAESFNWKCDTSVWNNPQALACVKKALRTWNCYTGVSWKLTGDTVGDTTKKDDISVIYFTNIDTASGVVMATKLWYLTNECYNISDSITFKDESDIEMRRNFAVGISWNYDTTGALDTPNHVVYFYDAILHELGHAHGLEHINDIGSLMYWTPTPLFRTDITTGFTYPGPATLLGALDMINTSIANSPSLLGCGSFSTLIPDTRGCIDSTMSVPEISQYIYNLILYPNPTNQGEITISYDLKENSYVQFKIFDCIGKDIINITNEHKMAGYYDQEINVSGLSQGVYLFVANINGQFKTIKFIKI